MAHRVALIVPTLDEQDTIARVLEAICAQGGDMVELVVVADGGSADLTRSAVESFARRDARVRLFDNPDRLQAAGVSAAVRALPAEIDTFIRVDAHADYPPDFVERLLQTADRTGADSVVVRLRSEGRGQFGKAVGALSNTVFGAGNSAHRMSGRSGWVDHGHHALFRREAFEAIGGYDGAFATNEDAELDVRLLLAGRQIWFENELVIGYHPRETLSALIRQYWRYGVGRAMTVRKHGMRLKLRQLLPVLLVLTVSLATLASLALPDLLLIPAAYLAACAVIGIAYALRGRGAFMILSAVVLPAIHLSWGAGFIRGYLLGRGGLLRAGGWTQRTADAAPAVSRDGADTPQSASLKSSL